MANQRQIKLLKQGVAAWNKWRRRHPKVKEPDLWGADLSKTDLSGADLSGAHLWGANLSGAHLYRAHLYRADLSGAALSGNDLSGADLSGADLSKTDLREVDLSEANLSKTDLSGAHLSGADLSGADLSGANLSGANLMQATLIRTNFTQANLTNCRIFGISAWDVDLQNSIQSNLVITALGQPTITVDNLEVAQFIYLLLKYEKLRDVLNSIMQRGVLLLGRFSDSGLDLLQAIAARLREMKYLPILFDFQRPDQRGDYTETIKILVGLSRFVIVDLSGPSIPQELYATVPHFDIPFVPLIEKERQIYSLFSGLLKYPWVLPPVEFASQEQLMEFLLSRVVEPAEEKVKERQALVQQLFHREGMS